MTESAASPPHDLLLEVLHDSRALGFLGPGPIEPQLAHAHAFLGLLGDVEDVLDLGSGGGLPGLVLAAGRPETRFVLLDGNQRRCAFLAASVERLGLADRVEVELGRAEELARRPDLDGRFDAVVARSFGPPAVTAECAVRFLRGVGADGAAARLLVSEPPTGSEDRWPVGGLTQLGLTLGERVVVDDATIQVLIAVERCADRLPRRVGIPGKRPLFGSPT